MKQQAKIKALNEDALANGAKDGASVEKSQVSTQFGINEPDKYIEKNSLYINKCTPWRYSKIFKNTTIRP